MGVSLGVLPLVALTIFVASFLSGVTSTNLMESSPCEVANGVGVKLSLAEVGVGSGVFYSYNSFSPRYKASTSFKSSNSYWASSNIFILSCIFLSSF